MRNKATEGLKLNELAAAGIRTLAAANTYFIERFIPDYTEEFTHPPADPTSAFAPLQGVDLDTILCEQVQRVVSPDNVVTLETVALQIAKQPGRRSCAGLCVMAVKKTLSASVTVRRMGWSNF